MADGVQRPISPAVQNQEEFDREYGFRRVDLSMLGTFIQAWHGVRQWDGRRWRLWARARVPAVAWLPKYSWSRPLDFLFRDVVAGLMVAIISVPQGLGYAQLADVPPIYGVYSCIFGPLVYALLTSSRISSPGSSGILSLMVGAAVGSAAASAAERADAAVALTFVVGAVQLLFALLNAGLLAVWLSDQLVEGLLAGASVHVVSSQLPHLFGIVDLRYDSAHIISFYSRLIGLLLAGAVNVPSMILSLISIGSIVFAKSIADPLLHKLCRCKRFIVPIEFLVVISSIAVTYQYELDNKFGLGIIGASNVTGFLWPQVPAFHQLQSSMLSDAIAMAIICFGIEFAITRTAALKHNYEIEANQQWVAIGCMQLVASFFHGVVGGNSQVRATILEQQGAVSQLSTFVCSAVCLLFVVFATQLITFLPKAVLSSIIALAVVKPLIKLARLPRYQRISSTDFVICFSTLLTVVLMGVRVGLAVSIVIALLTFVFRSQWAPGYAVGRVTTARGVDYKGMDTYRRAEPVADVLVYRFDAPLTFVNAQRFVEKLYRAARFDPLIERARRRRNKKPYGLRAVIVDCSSFAHVDLSGIEALRCVHAAYASVDVPVLLAACKVAVRQMMQRGHFHDGVPKACLFVSVADAVDAAESFPPLSPSRRLTPRPTD